MQSLFNPSLFHINKFQLSQLRPDLLKDIISIYLYVKILIFIKIIQPSIVRLFNFLPQETFNSFSVYIESNVFNNFDKVLKSKILEAILNLNKIDNRISIEYNMIDYNSSPKSNNGKFSLLNLKKIKIRFFNFFFSNNNYLN